MPLKVVKSSSSSRTEATKTVIARLVVDGKRSAYQVAKDTSVPHRSVVRYANNLRKGTVMRNEGGRPPKIDERGMESLSQYMASHPNCESIDLKAKIKKQALESYCRQHNLDIESILRERKAPKISPRTVAKYLYLLKPDLKP